jgi:hypothetical protein
MITVNQNSYWVKLAFPFKHTDQCRLPRTTNVCALFWRAVRTLTILSILMAGAGAVIAMIIVSVITNPQEWLKGLVIFLSICVAVAAGTALIVAVVKREDTLRYKVNTVTARFKESVPVQAFKGWKEKHCRLVKIKGVREWEDG